MTYTNQGRFKEAIEATQRPIRLEPDLAESYYRLRVAYGHLGKRDKAVENFKRAIVLKPDYADAHMDLGVIYLILGKRVAAVEQYKKSKRSIPAWRANYSTPSIR